MWFLLRKGKIAKIEGFENIKDDSRVIANIQRLNVGDEVIEDWIGNEKQVLTRMYLVCNSKQELNNTLKEYVNKVKVYDINNCNLLLKGFNVDKALEI